MSSQGPKHSEQGALASLMAKASRRDLLIGAASAAAAGMCAHGIARAAAAPAPVKPYRIDTHYHMFPPAFLAEERELVARASQGANPDIYENWSAERAIADMDGSATEVAVLSISTPGVYFGDQRQGRRLARLCNEYGAGIIQKYKGRFGMFAALPLPDVEGSLREIEYALDVLKLNGIGLMTSYGDRWPGDPAFFPVWEELNRRKATVYFHPTAANCCGNLVQETVVALEYPTDTTRCAASLYIGGVLSRCRDVNIILSHGGGSLPAFGTRLDGLSNLDGKPRWPTRAIDEWKRLNYDTAAIFNNPPAMAALMKWVPNSKIVMGSDFPYRSGSRAVKDIRDLGLFSEADLMAIERTNALRLLPSLHA